MQAGTCHAKLLFGRPSPQRAPSPKRSLQQQRDFKSKHFITMPPLIKKIILRHKFSHFELLKWKFEKKNRPTSNVIMLHILGASRIFDA